MDTFEQSESVPINLTRLPTIQTQVHPKDGLFEILLLKWSATSLFACDEATRHHYALSAWAALLRSYVRYDLITFEALGLTNHNNGRQCSVENSVETQLVVCQWPSRHETNHAAEQTLGPSIKLCSERRFHSPDHGVNSGVMVGHGTTSVPQHIDFMLKVNCDAKSDDIKLVLRRAKVSERFGKAIGMTLTDIFSKSTPEDSSTLTQPVISNFDLNCLSDFSKEPLSEHQECMHHLLQRSVDKDPKSEAVCAWDGSLSYEELNTYSNSLAKSLRSQGIVNGQYVPFAMEKSMWSVVVVLAILKAGAAFVPLEPTQPLSRIKDILSDVKAQVLVTSKSICTKFEPLVERVLTVSADMLQVGWVQAEAGVDELPVVQPQDVAFVLFTSGSTGKPKGMVMQHGAYATHTICHARAMGYRNSRVLQFAAHTFDVYVMDIFATLYSGGCICIPSEEDRKLNIVKVFNDFKIDLAILTPSFAHVLDPAHVPSLKTLAVGGEALKKETVQQWYSKSKVSLIQIYGPAEVGICILGEISRSSPSPEILGYPLDNSLCLLVDPEDPETLVPIGAVGELVVAGPTMLREYLDNPQKTSACFLESPMWASQLHLQRSRFYRTGDLLRYNVERMDGSFDFVGRTDSQVKYHGQRMELEDIEHHLSSIESVSACMVSMPKKGAFEGRLVAVVQLQSADQMRVKHNAPIKLISNPELAIGNVREHLAKMLPAYMIPNALLVVQNIPLTPSLKLNRPSVNTWVSDMKEEYFEAGTVRKMCCDKLRSSELTAHAISREYARLVGGQYQQHRALFEGYDFSLQAGGIDSIDIISLSNFVQNTWNVVLPVSLFLSSWATIRDIAAVIDGDRDHTDLEGEVHQSGLENEIAMLTKELFADIRHAAAPSKIKNILLTGATGFLGREILYQLLNQGLTVFALVRARDASIARRKLINTARAAGWWDEKFASQLEVWRGNLSLPNLGLDDRCLQRILAKCEIDESVDAIIHNGAKVHYGLDYSSLKDVNVGSTRELLKITAAADNHVRSFVYVSGGHTPTFLEEPCLNNIPEEQGYARSKLISQSMVERCMQSPEFLGKQLSVIKPGYIIGNQSNCHANLTDFIWRLVASCVELGYYSVEDSDRWLFVADQSRVASAIIDRALHVNASGSTVQVLDGLKFVDLWQIVSEELSVNLRPMPRIEWLDLLRKKVADKQDVHVMFPLMHMLDKGESIGVLGGPSLASAGVFEAIRANIRYLIDVGYLPSVACITEEAEISQKVSDSLFGLEGREPLGLTHQIPLRTLAGEQIQV